MQNKIKIIKKKNKFKISRWQTSFLLSYQRHKKNGRLVLILQFQLCIYYLSTNPISDVYFTVAPEKEKNKLKNPRNYLLIIFFHFSFWRSRFIWQVIDSFTVKPFYILFCLPFFFFNFIVIVSVNLVVQATLTESLSVFLGFERSIHFACSKSGVLWCGFLRFFKQRLYKHTCIGTRFSKMKHAREEPFGNAERVSTFLT